MTKPDGGQAFPSKKMELIESAQQQGRVPQEVHYPGMSLRDYFAGQMMSGVISNEVLWKTYYELATKRGWDITKAVAVSCYEYADALITERSKP